MPAAVLAAEDLALKLLAAKVWAEALPLDLAKFFYELELAGSRVDALLEMAHLHLRLQVSGGASSLCREVFAVAF